MTKKTPKPEGIPLSELFRQKGFLSSYEIEMRSSARNPVLVRAITRELHSKALKGMKFSPGRAEGSISESTRHIRQLVQDNPGLPAKELKKIADSSIIGDMSFVRFQNVVSEARAELNLPKPKATKRTHKK